GRVDRPGMARRRDRAHPGGDLRVGADRAGDLARLNRWPPTAVDFVIRVTEPWQWCGSSTGAVRRREPPVRARRLFDVQQSRSLLKFPDKDQAMEKILDLTMLSDIFPTGFHGAVSAGVEPGSSVYIAGAGPVGTAAAVGAQLLGASVAIMADMNADRLANAAKFGCETIDVSTEDPREGIARILGREEVDAGVDAVGFEARGHGKDAQEAPATVLNTLMDVTRAGGALGSPGLYVTGDPGGVDEAAQEGSLSVRLGLGWAKALSFTTGQCPVMKYHRQLMKAILHDKVQIADAVNAAAISLDDAPAGYEKFDSGVATKYVIDPHGMTGKVQPV